MNQDQNLCEIVQKRSIIDVVLIIFLCLLTIFVLFVEITLLMNTDFRFLNEAIIPILFSFFLDFILGFSFYTFIQKNYKKFRKLFFLSVGLSIAGVLMVYFYVFLFMLNFS